MVTAHGLEWTCAAPLWGPATTADRAAMRRPTLLAFDNDEFIDELTALLAKEPARVTDKVAVPESAREVPEPDDGPRTLKLFQAAHGRHYLVAANLVCQLPGIPDRVIDKAKDEVASFVLRRVDEKGNELAWVVNRPGELPEGEWRPVGELRAVVPGEQDYAMSALPYEHRGRRRRLVVGLVPVGRREQFEAAEIAAPPAEPDAEGDPRLAAVVARVVEALARLRASTDGQEALEREATAFMLLDLADWLQGVAPALWSALETSTRPGAYHAAALYDALVGHAVDHDVAGSWRDGLLLAHAERSRLFGDVDSAPTLTRNAHRSALPETTLEARLASFVGELGPAPPPATLAADAPPPKPAVDTTGLLYVVRAVYRRPRCGALHADVVSDASEPFLLAPFYDFDAPARPVRIALPIDTSIAGLRKFKKNVSFVLSKQLRGQMSRATDLKKALDGNLGSGKSFELGEICSFSIPVITICALIVLMIFIQLLNLVFWWVPFLKVCLPIPQPKVQR